MKKIFITIVFMLAGCVSPLDDMLDNKFTDINPSYPPEDIIGTWTGNNGPYILTLKIEASGHGYSCSSWNDKNNINKIKYLDGKIYFQEGTQMLVSKIINKLIGKFNYSLSS